MRALMVCCAIALGAAGFAGCANTVDADHPKETCIRLPNDDKLIAQASTSSTDAVMGDQDKGTFNEQRSQVPGGSRTPDEVDRRYHQDKDETHLENRRTPKQLDEVPCPPVEDYGPQIRAER